MFDSQLISSDLLALFGVLGAATPPTDVPPRSPARRCLSFTAGGGGAGSAVARPLGCRSQHSCRYYHIMSAW